MIRDGFCQFNGKRILLLQGPIGPFFQRFSKDLQSEGAKVFKINFNGGDSFFYRDPAVNFMGSLADWPCFIENYIVQNKINMVFLFGDCRPLHKVAHEIATQHSIEVGVFEEGYIRPDYITLEKYGTNGNSSIPRLPDFYADLPEEKRHTPVMVGKVFWYAAMWGMIYNTASLMARLYFKHDSHHRSLSIWQGLYWIRSLGRKWLYAITQRKELKKLIGELDKQYYLVPLQVHNDAQIHHHSDFFNVDAFISQTINSFAMHAPSNTHLVIKHHPMDRGFNHYGRLIDMICPDKHLRARVHYVHDLHLPTLLNHTRGVVVINSTVGLSALIHNCSVIACGNAIYDIPELTYQESLDKFWNDSVAFKLNRKLLNKFLHYVIETSQFNGNFYKTLDAVPNNSGVFWPSKNQKQSNKYHDYLNKTREVSVGL